MNMEQKENRGILPAQKRYEYVIVYCFVVTTDNIQIYERCLADSDGRKNVLSGA